MLRRLLMMFAVLTVLTGLAYPLLVTVAGRLLYPNLVAGSLVVREGTVVGSSLIGQSFTDPKYFWGRISATSPMPNNATASGGSNLGPTNPALLDAVRGRIDALKTADPTNSLPIPVDLVTASASGLDPHVSPEAALYQVTRIARARGIDSVRLRETVLAHVEGRQLGVFGEPRVNVLLLNLALDRAQ
jgi:K+-transporting ATPase ATPase C chain